MSERFLPYTFHRIEDADVAAVVEVLRNGPLTGGPAVDALEAAFRAETGAAHAVACANGTAALHLAMAALGLGPDDAVVVPTVTFLATANAVRFMGGTVSFADVDPDTGIMRPDDFAAALERLGGRRAVAVVPVHLGGLCAPTPEIASMARARGIRVVEDACHALGTVHDEAPVGACRDSDMACFSLHPAKVVAMGEGGVVTTNDPALAERLRRFRNHGMLRESDRFDDRALGFGSQGQVNPWYYEMPEIGFNYRASDILCALGASQLTRFAANKAQRRALAAHYAARLSPLAPVVRPVPAVPGCQPVRHLYPVLIDFAALGRDRAALMGALRERGVGTQVHYIPVHLQPYYRRIGPALTLPGAEAYYARTLSLPFFHAMTLADVDRVVDALAACL